MMDTLVTSDHRIGTFTRDLTRSDVSAGPAQLRLGKLAAILLTLRSWHKYFLIVSK